MLPLFAILLAVVLICGALAVDLSALENRGQTLQNTADAAALAAVATWQETGDVGLAGATVDEVLALNGVVGDDISVEVYFPSSTDVQVVVNDSNPDVYLGAIVGLGGTLTRDASARLNACDDSCDIVMDLLAPFTAASALATGDGFYPIAVGNRLYAINHNSDEIACVDRRTKAACWSFKAAIPYSGPRSGALTHTVELGGRIYWTAQDSSELRVHCWNTADESACGSTLVASLQRADWLGDDYEQRGGGIVEVNGQVYVFTDDHRVHCFMPPSLARCAGYGSGGKETGIGSSGEPALNPNLGVTGSNIDRVVNEGTGQIFHTLHIAPTNLSLLVYTETGTFLDCWDTAAAAPCGTFDSRKLHDDATRNAGRLFLHRDVAGVADGVCSTGIGDLECSYLDGSDNPGLTFSLSGLEGAFPPASEYGGNTGVHFYHEYSNRLLVSVGRTAEQIHCWDFTDESYCGFIQTPLTQDYGFTADGPCIYGFGHHSRFWAFSSDLTSGCPGATTEVEVGKCGCGTNQAWGLAAFNFDVGPGEDVAQLNVQVLNQDRELVYPDDGSEWIQIVGNSPHVVDLSKVPLIHDHLKVRVYLEATDTDSWLSSDPPVVVVGFRELPKLIE